MTRIAIFTATRWEFDAVRRAIPSGGEEGPPALAGSAVGRRGGCRVLLVRTGMGPERAGTVCRRALSQGPLDLAVSSGFACALVPSQIGDVMIGTDVAWYPQAAPSPGPDLVVPSAADHVAHAARAAREAGLPAHRGRFVTVPAVLWRAEEKRAMAETGVAIDMESGAIAAACAASGVPFLAVRTVSDLVDEDLPLDFNLFLKPRGWLRGAAQCLARPSSLSGLRRLRRQASTASGALRTFWVALLDRLA